VKIANFNECPDPALGAHRSPVADTGHLPCVLAIGGLDPGGGAGVLADARAIAFGGAFACAAVSVLTVQSTSAMRSSLHVSSNHLIASCTEVLNVQRVSAIKIGALGSVENTLAVARLLASHPELPAVVDTVMIPSRGEGRLLDDAAVRVLRDELLPLATVVTVNAPEAEVLTLRTVRTLEDAAIATTNLLQLGCKSVLLKGGHLSTPEAIDILGVSDHGTRAGCNAGGVHGHPHSLVEIASPRLALPAFHGGGCALASLIATRLAIPTRSSTTTPAQRIEDAVRWAKAAHHQALAGLTDVGGAARVLFASTPPSTAP